MLSANIERIELMDLHLTKLYTGIAFFQHFTYGKSTSGSYPRRRKVSEVRWAYPIPLAAPVVKTHWPKKSNETAMAKS